ncbi:MAG: flagellar biosynthesis anti-sigma factor FlgM [Treponemataceae bacterium]
MMIDKLKGINPVESTQKKSPIQQVYHVNDKDSITISAESQRLSEAYLAKKIAMEAPDIREDKVEEVRRKLEDPTYIKKAIEEIANRILASE